MQGYFLWGLSLSQELVPKQNKAKQNSVKQSKKVQVEVDVFIESI